MERQFDILCLKWDGSNGLIFWSCIKVKGYTIGTYNIKCLNTLSGKVRKSNQFDIKKRWGGFSFLANFQKQWNWTHYLYPRFTFTR